MKEFFIGLLVGLIGGALCYSSFHTCVECELPHVPEDSTTVILQQPEFFLSDTITIEGLYKACDYYEIQQPDIVVAQAILETGLFKSDLCIEHHNLFGLYNSRIKEYYHFNHWAESVKAYRNKVQYRYQNGDYYDWLERIGYAEDSLYVSKLKNVRTNYNLGVE
jgi:flagellum-specific peptidoglycan hydrolase FlgJ